MQVLLPVVSLAAYLLEDSQQAVIVQLHAKGFGHHPEVLCADLRHPQPCEAKGMQARAALQRQQTSRTMPVWLVSYILNSRRNLKALSLRLAILPAMRSFM